MKRFRKWKGLTATDQSEVEIMMLAIVSASLIGMIFPGDAPPPVDVKIAYAEAKAQATRSPEDQVKLALWCESHGLTTQKLHHLTLAILADPKNAMARGLLGLVAHDGRWLRPETIAEKAKADPILSEYETRRLAARYTADAQWTLGLWADDHGLKEQAKAHFTAVTRLDPKRDLAWKKLGYKKHDGRWVTDAQLALEKADAEVQKAADRKWKPVLEKYKSMLDQPSKREAAEALLSEVTDPRAVPMIGQVFARLESTQPIAVRLLGQVDSAAASKALAFLAMFAKSAEARRTATETLRRRDAREYADLLIALIRDPIKYEVKPVGGPGSPGTLMVQGPSNNLKRLYSPPPAFRPGDTLKIDPSGVTVVDRSLYSYLSDLPNVTGSSRYSVQGVGMIDRYGFQVVTGGSVGLIDKNFGFPASHEGLDGPVLSRGMTPTPTDYATLRQSLAAGDVSAMSHFFTNKHASQTTKATNSGLPILNSPSLIAISPYVDYSYAIDIPLSQVLAESRKAAMAADEQLKADTKILESWNQEIRGRNDQVVGILNTATGQSLPPDREKWTRWWVDQIGYAFVTDQTTEKTTIVEEVPLAYQPQLTPINETIQFVSYHRQSCFGAGTPVQTVDGLRPIESLKVGDLVLSQSIDTGALAYKPILVVHHNPPSPTFRIKVEGEAIVSSYFHRFWVAGRGWVMARDLKAGDAVRTLGGVVKVESVDDDRKQLVYNLDVADAADFFVGKLGALVHDNTLPDPRLVPFDGPAKALAVKSGD